jgi:2-aminoadipate transaminase
MAMDLGSLQISAETADLKRSVMRDLLSLAVDPEIISLAGGLPASELLPAEALRRSFERVLARDARRSLQYSPPFRPLQRWIAEWMTGRGVPCDSEQIFITNGGQQGLAILSRLFLARGQPAVIEAITFTGIQQITAGRGAVIRAIPTSLDDGADMQAFEAALAEEPRPALAVLIPDFHNPLGVSLSARKRLLAAQLATRYQVPLIEDDPYSALRFAGEFCPPIKAHDEAGLIFYVGSFSKMVAPAMRLGWIVASQALLPQITVLRESLDLESSALIQRVIADFLEAGSLDPHLQQLNQANCERCQALLEALEQHLGDIATWTRPEGGLFVWVTLKPEIDAWELFPKAVEAKVAYIPGFAFAVNGGHRNTMRLNFSNLAPEKIQQGISRLASVIRRAI